MSFSKLVGVGRKVVVKVSGPFDYVMDQLRGFVELNGLIVVDSELEKSLLLNLRRMDNNQEATLLTLAQPQDKENGKTFEDLDKKIGNLTKRLETLEARVLELIRACSHARLIRPPAGTAPTGVVGNPIVQSDVHPGRFRSMLNVHAQETGLNVDLKTTMVDGGYLVEIVGKKFGPYNVSRKKRAIENACSAYLASVGLLGPPRR